MNKIKKETILVTGGAGFIGSHLCEKLLSLNYSVICVDNFDPFYDKKFKINNLNNLVSNNDFKIIEGDIADLNTYDKIEGNINAVFHLAAKAGVRPSIENELGYLQTNILGTQMLLKWIEKKQIKKIIFASSSSIYGNNKNIPFSEDHKVNMPISPYAYSKQCCELMNFTHHHLFNTDVINLRLFTAYGPRQRPDLAIHKFVKLILNGQPITMYGDGEASRDYTYVDDIINGFISSLQFIQKNKNVYEIINIGNNHPVKLMTLISLLEKLLQKKPTILTYEMQQGDVENTFADISKAKKLLGYNPSSDIELGLSKFIDWYKQNLVT